MLELGVHTERGSCQRLSLVHQRVINFYVHARTVRAAGGPVYAKNLRYSG